MPPVTVPPTLRETTPPPVTRRRRRPAPVPQRYEPRFLVVERKPPAATYRRTGMSGVQRALLVAIFPAVLLLIYVCFWTMAMRGGYYRNELRTRIRTMQTENAELEAQKQKLQAPDKIALKAQVEQGMKIPGAREQLWLKASPAEPAPRQVSWRNTGAPAQP